MHLSTLLQSLLLSAFASSTLSHSENDEARGEIETVKIDHTQQHERRQATDNSFVLYGSPGHYSSLVVDMALGSPQPGSTSPPMIPTLIDFGHKNIIVSSACQAATSGHQKRSACPAGVYPGGYNYQLSSSAVITQGVFTDTDFSQTGTSGTNKLKVRSGTPDSAPFTFSVRRIIDKIWLTAALTFLVPMVIADKLPDIDLSSTYMDHSAIPPTPEELITLAIQAAMGLQGIPLPVGLPPVNPPPGADTLVAVFALPNILQNPVVQIDLDEAPAATDNAFVVGVNFIPPADEGSGGFFKRSNVPKSGCISVKFRGWDSTKFNGNLVWFRVYGTIGTQSYWRLALRNIAVTVGASSNGAQIATNPATNAQNSMDTVQFDSTNTYIKLTPARVAALYKTFGSNFKPPSSTNPYYTYVCGLQFTVSFEFKDLSGVYQLLTLDQQDFYHGLSPDFPGYCIGAIQELPSGLTQQTIGLNFFKSFYVAIALDSTLSASRIGLAVLKRTC